MMLAARYTNQPIAGWWLSEKFDGVRAFWDGSALRTRTWREIVAPAWFIAALPQGTALDGELWGGRGSFQVASELARFERAADPVWHGMRLMVFDWPTTDAVPVETRLENARKLTRGPHCEFVAQRRCRDLADMHAEFAAVVAAGGEGLVLRRPGSFYEFGRSSCWLKVKPAGID